MELSDLRIFKAVVREGGITRAAESLHRVQSNVTTRIRQLEEELGVDLFVREGKRLHLSPTGKLLLTYADQLLALSEEALNAIQDSHPRGMFRLGSMESTAAVRLPAPLAEFSKNFPDVKLELQTGNPTQLLKALLDGEIDAALVAEPISDARVENRIAFEEETVIVTAESYPTIFGPQGVPKTMIVFEQGCPHRRRLEAWYTERNELPERTIELGSYHAMLGCVIAGMGAALLPKSVLDTFPEAKRLKCHVLPEEEAVLRTLLIWRKGFKSPNVTALSNILSGEA
ncbi:MAG: LysR substrate-binding domain-containing protein [Proteobacteria bacterium]|nr:LysR substrate-binding domain-containing protein [Pseudomonadota bacterium]